MLLDDVLKVVGTSELRDFPWGPSVITLVNSFIEDHSQLTLASTGVDLVDAIGKVEETQRLMLLQARIGIVAVAPHTCSANDEDGNETVTKDKTRSIVSIGFTIILCFIAMVLTLSMSYSATKNGTELDLNGLGSVLKIIGEVITGLYL
jgi:hypothetical protein